MPPIKRSKRKQVDYTPQQITDCVLWRQTMGPEDVRRSFRKKYGNKGYLPGGSKGPNSKSIDEWVAKLKETGSVHPKPRQRQR